MSKEKDGIWVLAPKRMQVNFNFDYHLANLPNQLPEHGCRLIVMVIDITEEWLDTLVTIRSKAHYRLTPIFHHGHIDNIFNDLFDGAVDELMFSRAASIQERINLLPEFNRLGGNQELLILSYLFSRPGLDIKGHLNYQDKYIFDYPLITALFSGNLNFDAWTFLQNLASRDLIAEHTLVDEIQSCSHCESGLLNFKNSCPNCHSVDIKPQKFIHCLACGDVGPVSNFMRESRLVCGKCHTKLRQIGVDYDKPAEDKLCHHCGYFFNESIANVVCLVCQRVSLPQDLKSRRLFTYSMTKRGEYFARGLEKSLYQHAGSFFNFIDFSSFMAIVNWQAKLSQRQEEDYFFLMSLSVTNEQEIISTLGLKETEKLLGDFFSKVRLLLRDTDLATRDEGMTLFFLPLTHEKGIRKLASRVSSYVKGAVPSETLLQVKVSYISSREIVRHQLTSELMLAELSNRQVNFDRDLTMKDGI